MQRAFRAFGFTTRLPIRLRKLLCASVLAGAALSGTPVLASAFGFDHALDEFRMTGNVEFFDDFEDGSRTTPPTSAFVDYNGTVTIEQGGFWC